ncbi:MAG: DUF1638 domain-containing protein, partial [Dehalococcoidales bacterium]|nr:DUF1638 domain-containing protein [Dehalococcoidales bacterium]
LEEYSERFSRESAKWVIDEEFKNYTRLALIDTGAYDPAEYREYARANAAFLGIAFEEIKGSLAFFKKIAAGQWSEDEFIILQPGEEFTQEMFFSLITARVPSI